MIFNLLYRTCRYFYRTIRYYFLYFNKSIKPKQMIFFGWIALSFVVAWFGDDRRIGFGGALVLSLLLSPLIGAIIVLLSERKSDIAYREQVIDSTKRQEDVIRNMGNSQPKYSKADEIKKLKQLLDEGAITQDEFEKEKREILLRTV